MAERQTVEISESRDKSGLKNGRSGREEEIKRDKERVDTDTTDKQTDGHPEQSAVTVHLTVKPTHSSIPAHLCLPPPRNAL